MVQFNNFDESDFTEILDLCNRNMEYDTLTETLLREKTIDDADFDPELILTLWEKKTLRAFCSGVIREINGERTGYIKLMAVEKAHRRQGLGKRLYQEIEKRFLARGAQKVRVYDVPFNYFMPGIDPRYTEALSFFETMGFTRFADTSNLSVDLTNQDFSTEAEEKVLAGENIIISRADYADQQEVMQFVDTYFPLWRTEISNTYNSLPVSLHIARLNGEIKAFSGHNGNNFGTGWFGPMGTHPDLRGKGIGGILLKRCLQDMKEWELETSIIPWVGPIRFYSYYANARVERVFWRYEKQIKG